MFKNIIFHSFTVLTLIVLSTLPLHSADIPEDIPENIPQQNSEREIILDNNEAANPASQEFLLKQSSMFQVDAKVLTLGCGAGILELWMASELFPEGTITATDKDIEGEAITKTCERAANIKNIEFKGADVNNLEWSNEYDFIHCRFVFQHLATPRQALQNILKALKPGGTLIIEDDEISANRTEPPHAAYQDAIALLRTVARNSQGNYDIGRELTSLLQESGASILEHNIKDEVLTGQRRRLFRWTLESINEAFVNAHILEAGTIDALVPGLKELEKDDENYKIFQRVHQVHAQKPHIT